MYVRELQREKWRTQSQALNNVSTQGAETKNNTTRKSIPENEHPYQFSRNLLYVCTKSKRATWAGHITQSEQVYSALESEVVMFRLFVLCTFRFRKKYCKSTKELKVLPKPVQKATAIFLI